MLYVCLLVSWLVMMICSQSGEDEEQERAMGLWVRIMCARALEQHASAFEVGGCEGDEVAAHVHCEGEL